MQDIIKSAIRTFVPYIVGLVFAWLAEKGVHVQPDQVASATALLTFAVGSVYYLVVRLLEHKWPKLGVLLGVPSKPVYGEVK